MFYLIIFKECGFILGLYILLFFRIVIIGLMEWVVIVLEVVRVNFDCGCRWKVSVKKILFFGYMKKMK